MGELKNPRLWEEPVLSASRGSLVKPGAVLALPDMRDSERCANAVLIAGGLAITARHCIQKDGRRLRHARAPVLDCELHEVARRADQHLTECVASGDAEAAL